MATVGDRIREIRTERRMTQEQLAERTDISKGFLSDVETGKRGISSEYLLRIANALGASLDYLVRGTALTSGTPQEVVIPPELSEAAQEMGLSYAETAELLGASDSVVARRSMSSRRRLSVEDWKSLHKAIKKVFG